MKFENVLTDYYINPKYLSLYRLLYCFIVLFLIGLPSYTWIANSLNYLYDPPFLSFASLFDEFPGSWFFITLSILNISFFMLMFLGVASRWTSTLFSITCIIGHNFWYSFGKIDHLLLWYLAPAFLGFAGWGQYFSLNIFKKNHHYKDIETNTNSMLILIFALSIGFTMFTSAAEKISGGWLYWNGEAVRFHFLRNYLSLHRTHLLTYPLISYDNHVFWKFMDYSGIILELGFIFSVVRINFFRVFIAAGVIFHVLVLLMFNIPFYSNLIVYLIFIDWKMLYEKWHLQSVFDYPQMQKGLVKVMAIISICFMVGWLTQLYHTTYFFTFPGLLQFVLSNLPISNSFEASLSIFFLLVLLFTLYVLYCQFESYIKAKNKKFQEIE